MTIFRFRQSIIMLSAMLFGCGPPANQTSADNSQSLGVRFDEIEERLLAIEAVQANLINQVAAEPEPSVDFVETPSERRNELLMEMEQQRLEKRVSDLERQRLFEE